MKGSKKKAAKNNDKVRVKPWPIVTPDVCAKCPIQCPAGVEYLQSYLHARKFKATKGVVCKKELYEERIKQGLPPFYTKAITLWKAPVKQ